MGLIARPGRPGEREPAADYATLCATGAGAFAVAGM